MIQKKLWTELLTSNHFENVISTDVLTLAGYIDTLMLQKFEINTSLQTYLTYIKTSFFSSEGNNQWSALNIFISSYSLGDQRFVYLLNDKLKKYLGFYNKFISQDGLAKTISVNRDYEDHSGSRNDNQNIHSELPQIELNNFEDGIKYASTLDKDSASGVVNTNGENSETRNEVTWDEAMENLRTMLFNDLIDYITNIPNMLFNHYSLDTTPYLEIIKSTFRYFENLSEVYKL